jgi:hypothetical protein
LFNHRIRTYQKDQYEPGVQNIPSDEFAPYAEGYNSLFASDRLHMITVTQNKVDALKGIVSNSVSQYGPPRSITEENGIGNTLCVGGPLGNNKGHPNYEALQ